MAEPDSSEDVETEAETGSSLPPRPPKRRRHRRTVYSVEQREELERFFQNNHYPSYDERESLAARLDLQEQQVQVWFKNRRAKESRLRRGTGTRQQGPKARASSQGPEVCVSAPAPAAADPGVSEDPVLPSDPGVAEDLALLRELLLSEDPLFSGGSAFPEGAGFYNPFRGVAAAETSASSHLQAQRDPPQVAQSPGPAAPAPAPDPFWTEGFDANDFWPELDFVDLLSL